MTDYSSNSAIRDHLQDTYPYDSAVSRFTYTITCWDGHGSAAEGLMADTVHLLCGLKCSSYQKSNFTISMRDSQKSSIELAPTEIVAELKRCAGVLIAPVNADLP